MDRRRFRFEKGGDFFAGRSGREGSDLARIRSETVCEDTEGSDLAIFDVAERAAPVV